MDHELKQRLIGAVVVTALCAIFIPMLFDDPVENSGQVVSELSIPAPVNQGTELAGKVPDNAEQVLKLPEEPLSSETAGDTLESTGAAEEIIEEPEAKQGRSGESLYAESEGYTREDGNAEEPIDEPEVNRPKPHPKKVIPEQSAGFVQSRPLSSDPTSGVRAKVQAKDEAIAKESAKIKKVVEAVKSAPVVRKLDSEPPITAGALDDAEQLRQITPKQPSSAKSLAAAVAEAKKPTVAPKASPKLVRWYIQLGSFSKKENAMSLWESLHEQGLPASLDTVQTDKGISYRLRVGPELDGKKAAAMKSRLDKQNIKAILISE